MNDQITSIIDDNKEIELKEIELIDDNKEIESETFIEIDSVIDDEEITFEIDNLEDPNPKNFSGKIQKYYIPQIQSGLSVIKDADFALFVNSLNRICSLKTMGGQ